MLQNDNRKKVLLIGLVLSMIMWGLSWPSGKVLTRYGPVLEIAFLRFCITIPSVFVLLKLLRIKMAIHRKGLGLLAISGIMMAGYSLLFFSGIQKGMPGAGGVLVTTMTPIITYLLALLLVKRIPSSREWLGMGLGLIAGIILLQVWRSMDSLLQGGNLFFVASVLVWVVLSRFTAQAHRFGSPLAFTFWMYVLCVLLLSLFCSAENLKHILKKGDALFWSNMLFNGALNTGLATTIYFLATSKLGPERTSSFIYIVPVAAAGSSFLFLGEHITWYTIVGGILGMAAVWLINSKQIAHRFFTKKA